MLLSTNMDHKSAIKISGKYKKELMQQLISVAC